jgi:hypothetical protein
MWQIKADIVEEPEGPVNGPAIWYPNIDELAWIPEAAGDTLKQTVQRGVFTAVEGESVIRLTKPPSLPEALWWTCGAGGIRGSIESLDERDLVIR